MPSDIKQEAIDTLKVVHLVYIGVKEDLHASLSDGRSDCWLELTKLMGLNQFEDLLSMIIRRITLTTATDRWLSRLSETHLPGSLHRLRLTPAEYAHTVETRYSLPTSPFCAAYEISIPEYWSMALASIFECSRSRLTTSM
jgi:hypothetical protein